jgi:predicted Zn-dependent peptidase
MFKRTFFAVIIVSFISCKNWQVEKQEPIVKSESKKEYISFPDDPTNTRIYTLNNGLKVYISPNKATPRIQTLISVNAGSVNDPADATGLAHYLEHMLFKGTDKIGTINYEAESKIIAKISVLFEELKATSDSSKRKGIYLKIDSLSQEAGKYACPNELDQLYQSIGASQTNAFTSFDYTGYLNNIPSDQLENWMKIEDERFKKPVLRLFHTELEAVYEEKNISLDNADRQMSFALYENVFPKHNYGQQTTIGTTEHLKSPSMVAIEKFYNTYYVANNMAVHLIGDVNPDEAIELVKKYFGDWKTGYAPEYKDPIESPIKSKKIIRQESTEAPQLVMAYRFDHTDPMNTYLATMTDMILANSKAGLIDVNINQPQKAIGAYSYHYPLKDYTMHVMGGQPTQGQSLEELEALLLEQIEKIKAGDFPDWLPQAVVNNLKIDELKELRSNRQRMYSTLDAFSKRKPWEEQIKHLDKLGAITKKQLIEFVKKNYSNNYVIVYREQVDSVQRESVAKPPITPISGNENNRSLFLENFTNKLEYKFEKPVFPRVDSMVNILEEKKGFKLISKENTRDDLFELEIVFPGGSFEHKDLGIALSYAQRLGTDSLSAKEINEAWYRLGVNMSLGSDEDETYLILTGLAEYQQDALKLFQHWLSRMQEDQELWQALLNSYLQSRKNQLSDKEKIMWSGLRNFLTYGKNSPFMHQLNNEELQAIQPSNLIKLVQEIIQKPHEGNYYGKSSQQEIITLIKNAFGNFSEIPEEKQWTRKETKDAKVFFIDQNTQQAEILMLSKGDTLQQENWAVHQIMNEYFGGGMSSIVFQELREKRALAYSVYGAYSSPKQENDPSYAIGYIGTQADKYEEALTALLDLFDNIPVDTMRFERARNAILKEMLSERIPEYSAINKYFKYQDMGWPSDYLDILYDQIQEVTLEEMMEYFHEHMSNKNFHIGISGPKAVIDLKALEKYGEVIELNPVELFPY